MRVTLDRARCCGNLECVRIAPAMFGCDEEGLGVVLDPEVPDGLKADAEEAMYACPARAIDLVA